MMRNFLYVSGLEEGEAIINPEHIIAIVKNAGTAGGSLVMLVDGSSMAVQESVRELKERIEKITVRSRSGTLVQQLQALADSQ